LNDSQLHDVNEDYLRQALARAVRQSPAGPVEVKLLTGGRTGARVMSVGCGGDRFVLKQIPLRSWRTASTGVEPGGEGYLWQSGAVRDLGPGLRWPVLDVSIVADQHWLLMEDVSTGFRSRGQFTRADSTRLLDTIAGLHARYYESPALETLPLPRIGQQIHLFTKTYAQLTGRSKGPEWVDEFVDDFQVIEPFFAMFLDILGPKQADGFLALCDDLSWHDELAKQPSCLLHGDLRRANVAFLDDGVSLIDWEFSGVGPPASDAQEHCFLHYTCYPPDGTDYAIDACADLRDGYAEALERELGSAIDRGAFARSWSLGWLRWFVNLGFLLVDPIFPDGGTAEERAVIRARASAALAHALDIANGP
jgi:hypothetical protein